ncbi:MAG: hypothetical protein O2943_04220 [Actinomycetota bacterium]|nr:hypothetical protein [Actinomycetota bacterium]
MRQYRILDVRANWAVMLPRLALAVLLAGGWATLALALPAQSLSIVAEDDAEPSEPEAPAPAEVANDTAPAETTVEDDEAAVEDDDAAVEDDEAGVEDDEAAVEDDEAAVEDDEAAVEDEDAAVDAADTGTASLSIDLVAEIGAPAGGSPVNVSASNLLPESRATLIVFSTPQVIGVATADAEGTLSMSATLPSDLLPGDHTVVV